MSETTQTSATGGGPTSVFTLDEERAAYREIIPAIIRQSREPGWCIVRELPKTAQSRVAAE